MEDRMRRITSIMLLLVFTVWQAQPVMATLAKKGVERDVTFAMKDTGGDFAVSLTVTASVSKDGGAFAGSTNSVSEISNGLYKLTLSAAEMTTNMLDLWLSAEGAIDLMVHLEIGDYTRADLEALVDDIGVAGVGLSAIPWNADWDDDAQSEVVDALTAEGYSSTRAGYIDELAAANLPSDIAAIPTTDYTTTINLVYVDTNELQANQDWNVWDDAARTLTALDEDDTDIDLDGSAVGDVTSAIDVANTDDCKADVSGLPTTDLTTTVNLIYADTQAIPTTDLTATINLIYADTDDLQSNQGDWLTATGFMPDTEDGSSFTSLPAVDVSNTDDCKANVSGIPTTDLTATVNLIYGDTNEIQGDWASVTASINSIPTTDYTTTVNLIYDDTNELQGDWVNAGRLDVILDELTTQGDTNETNQTTILTRMGEYDDTATMEGSLFAGQQAIYNSYGIGSGANTVTLQVSDSSDSTGLADTKVYVMDSTNSVLLWCLETESTPAGQSVFYAADGSYYLRIYKIGYTANNNPQELTVSGDTTATVYMTENSVGSPVTSSTCRVTINVFEQTGNYYDSQEVTAEFDEYSAGGRVSSAGAVVCNIAETKKTDSTGIVYFDLPQASTCTFTFNLPEDRFSETKTIPEAATETYDDLVDA